MTTETGARDHAFCVICGPCNEAGLRLRFQAGHEGTVSATVPASERLQGYTGLMHGGVIAALLDGAMTHALFHRGIRALTAELRIRYRRPVDSTRATEVRARVVQSRPPLHRLEAALVQEGTVRVRAHASFMEQAAHGCAGPAV